MHANEVTMITVTMREDESRMVTRSISRVLSKIDTRIHPELVDDGSIDALLGLKLLIQEVQ
jgi:hypothetical protein